MAEQRTDEWFGDRLGVITGTKAHELLSSATTRKTLMAKLIAEHATASTKQTPQTYAMRRGQDIEDEAVSYYKLITGESVTGCDDYIVSDMHPFFACSPDGLIGEDGGLEIKRLDEHNHIKTKLGDVEKQYMSQIRWNLFVTDRKWWDYLGYCETMPEPLTGDIRRFKADDLNMVEVEKTALKFVAELEKTLTDLGITA